MTDARSIDSRFRAWPRPVSEDVSARRRPAAQRGLDRLSDIPKTLPARITNRVECFRQTPDGVRPHSPAGAYTSSGHGPRHYTIKV
jgi:hypothetical protein